MIALVFGVIFLSIAGRVHVVRPGVDVRKDHPRARLRDGFGRGDEAVGRHDDFVAGADAQGFSAIKRASVPLPTPMQCWTPQKSGKGLLEVLDVRAADESCLRKDLGDDGIDLRFDRFILFLQVYKLDGHNGPHETRFRIKHSDIEAFDGFSVRASGGAGGVSRVDAGLVDVLRHDGARADDDAVADFHGQDCRVGADGDVIADEGRLPELLSGPAPGRLREQDR